jgi:hypothetical protein
MENLSDTKGLIGPDVFFKREQPRPSRHRHSWPRLYRQSPDMYRGRAEPSGLFGLAANGTEQVLLSGFNEKKPWQAAENGLFCT